MDPITQVAAPAQPAAAATTAPAPAAEQPASAPSAAAQAQPAAEPSTPVDAFSAVQRASDERYRKLQAAKDREIAELKRHLDALQYQNAQPQSNVIQMPANPIQQQQQQQQQQQAPRQESVGKKFLDMIDAKKEDEAVDFLLAEAERRAEERILSKIRADQEESAFRSQYLAQMDAVNSQLQTTSEEQGAMIESIRATMVNGRPTMSPHEALMRVRFGAPEQVLQVMNHAARASAQPASPQPPAPPVPGFSISQAIQSAQQPQQSNKPRLNLEGMYRSF